MFNASIENCGQSSSSSPTTCAKYRIDCDGTTLSFARVIDLWCSDKTFRDFFNDVLAQSDFAAYRWETPVLNSNTVNHPFEFVLLNSPEFCRRKTDPNAFREYFVASDSDQGIVSFENLGGDAKLIVPSPRTDDTAYGHLAAFIRNAPATQVDALWQIVGRCVKERISDQPFWLSTAGGGVSWLHVRMDTSPKYYGYAPYRRPDR
jgi:hypothetical protein